VESSSPASLQPLRPSEVTEELGLDVEAKRLLGVVYRPPTPGGRGNALRFVFDGGVLTPTQIERIVLPPVRRREP
jgi:hypothetical protein